MTLGANLMWDREQRRDEVSKTRAWKLVKRYCIMRARLEGDATRWGTVFYETARRERLDAKDVRTDVARVARWLRARRRQTATRRRQRGSQG